MSERQPIQHNRLGKLGRLTLAASLLAGGASLVPASVDLNITSNDAEGATCVPYTDIALNPSSSLQTIRGIKRGILTGDVSIPKKGLFHDSLSTTGQEIIIDFPTATTLSGIKVDNKANLRKINACATNTQFNTYIGANDRSKTPAGNARYELGAHRITNPNAETFVLPPTATPCNPVYTEESLPITGPGETTGIANVQRAIITGDISRNGFGPDSDPLTGETVVINLPSVADITGIKNPYGAHAVIMEACATTDQFNAQIGKAEAAQTLANGGQSFKITTP